MNDYNNPVVTDLSKFGFREIKMASELLNEYVKTPNILGDGVNVAMNCSSTRAINQALDYLGFGCNNKEARKQGLVLGVDESYIDTV